MGDDRSSKKNRRGDSEEIDSRRERDGNNRGRREIVNYDEETGRGERKRSREKRKRSRSGSDSEEERRQPYDDRRKRDGSGGRKRKEQKERDRSVEVKIERSPAIPRREAYDRNRDDV